MNLPNGVEYKKWIVELWFLRVVFESEEYRVAEPYPAEEAHRNETITSRTLIQI